MRIVVTGANGFVGRATCANLLNAGHDVTALVRRAGTGESRVHERVIADDNFASLATATSSTPDPADAFVLLAA
ncbi:NAD-dependent epimerase/dehydratase family protein, partial [Caballeronia sp.]|uniref:NAD-dependent epimerase/dehydratase family protein n=1 Tax=Caballeronia sp. TaxID=1931223 RepID=UPI003C6FF9B1